MKNVFRDFIKLCEKLDLYGKELIAIDGSKFKAVNSKDRNYTEKKLQDRIGRIEEKNLDGPQTEDLAEDAAAGEKSAKEIKDIVRGLTERKELYQEYADELEQTGETQKSLTDADSRLIKQTAGWTYAATYRRRWTAKTS